MINRLFEIFPYMEVFLRNLYWKSSIIFRLGQFVFRSRKSYDKHAGITRNNNVDLLIKSISEAGIGTGDILIVHSDFGALKSYGLTPQEMIDRLLTVIGKTGTLVMPAIPIFKEAPPPFERFNDSLFEKSFVYNLARSRIWTGAMPQAMIKMPGALRSRHPLNSVVAYGLHAAAMLESELCSDQKLPCGEGSAWAYCYRHDAKILMLGVDTVHSLTMIHVAEDLFAEKWPVKNWYRTREFNVIDGDFNQIIRVSERRPEWALFYAERRFSRDLKKFSIVKEVESADLKIALLSSSKLIDFLNTRKATAYPYFIPYWLR